MAGSIWDGPQVIVVPLLTASLYTLVLVPLCSALFLCSEAQELAAALWTSLVMVHSAEACLWLGYWAWQRSSTTDDEVDLRNAIAATVARVCAFLFFVIVPVATAIFCKAA